MGEGERSRRQGRRAFLATSASALVCGAAWGWTERPLGVTEVARRVDVWRKAREVVRSGRLGRLVWGQVETGAETPIEELADRLVYAADAETVRAASFVGSHAGSGGLATLECDGGVTLVVVMRSDDRGPVRLTLRGVDGVLRCEGNRMTVRLNGEGPTARIVWPD